MEAFYRGRIHCWLPVLSSIENQFTPHPKAPVCAAAVDCYRLALTRRLCDTAVAITRTHELGKKQNKTVVSFAFNRTVCIICVFVCPLLPKAVSLR